MAKALKIDVTTNILTNRKLGNVYRLENYIALL